MVPPGRPELPVPKYPAGSTRVTLTPVPRSSRCPEREEVALRGGEERSETHLDARVRSRRKAEMAAAPGLGHLRRWCSAGVVSAVGWLQTSRQRRLANSQERGGQLSVWEEGLRGSAWDGKKGGTA